MRAILYISSLLAISALISFSAARRDCHIVFGVSSKLRVVDEGKEGNSRTYEDQKKTFRLSIHRYSSKTPHETLKDSMNVWTTACKTTVTNVLFEADTLVINEIPLHNLSYKCTAGENNLINNIFGFSSNSHFYKMHIEFPSSKKEKGEKEMSKIISSLNIHCK